MMELTSPELFPYLVFGLILNFVFSIVFGLYLTNNIGIEEMMMTKGEKEQPWWMSLSLAVPYAKMAITLYRVAILQFYFLDQGKTHKDFWIYLTGQE
jgi:hypothetical protein